VRSPQEVVWNERLGEAQPPNVLELHYRLVVQGMEEGVVFHDQDGIIRASNPSAERILRIPADALLGRRSVLEHCNPVREDETLFPLEECPALVCLRTGRSERDVVIGVRRQDGSLSWLSFASHPLLRADSSRAGVVTSFRDITELKIRESQNTQRFLEANNAVRLHDEFLATAAHELRTPLTALKLQMQNLLRNASLQAGMAVEVLISKLQASVRQTEKLNTLVNLLLDVSRMRAGPPELHCALLNLAELVDEVIARNAEELSSAGVSVSHQTQVVMGEWDAQRLEQVVSNLLTNALKYGNGKPIQVSTGVVDGEAMIRVRDHGPGIPLRDQSRIFERFERAHHGGQSGMGLGLWIVREIIEAHGGRIDVRSALGEGSTFTVRLPLNPENVRRRTKADPP
jgi:PAS domain S-box-containing protein